MELHNELKSTLPPEELYPEGSEFEQAPGADYFPNNLIKLYKEDPKMRDDLYAFLLRGGVTNMSVNQNTSLPLNAYNFLSV